MALPGGLAWNSSLYLLPPFVGGLVAAVLAVYAWRYRHNRAGTPFIVLLVGLAIWSFGHGIELAVPSQSHMVAFRKIAFVGTVTVPTAWLLLALEYAGFDRLVTRRTVALLAVEPAVMLGLALTNGGHGLVWSAVGVDTSDPFRTLEIAFGPANWVNVGYSYLLVVVGIGLLIWVVGRANRLRRRQSIVLVAGALVPLGANVAFNVTPALNPIPNLDLTTFAFAITGVCFALAQFRFRMLDIVPVARETLVERMDDGVVVLDPTGEIVDLNATARSVLGEGAVGTAGSETVLGDGNGVAEGFRALDVDGESRSFDVTVTSIDDFRGDRAGQFVVLRDITELEVLRNHEQRLSVLNRVLRHNIRNELTVMSGHTRFLKDHVSEAGQEHLAALERAQERILHISDEARHVETTIAGVGTDRTTVDVAAVVSDSVASVRSDYPDATISVTVPDIAPARTAGRAEIETAITALVENAVAHNPDPEPRAWVTVDATDETVSVAIADDGPGIPDGERAILDRDQETILEHGTGLGLWLVTWIVDASDGDVSFAESDAGGSRVTVTLPRADQPDARPEPDS